MATETMQFSVWSNCKTKKPVYEWNIQQLHDAIKTGTGDGIPTFKDTINELRKEKCKTKRKAIKESRLPAVTVSGTFYERKISSLKQHSGLVQIDIDKHSNPDALRGELVDDEYVALSFISPSGTGVKAVVKVNPDSDTHLAQYNALANYFKEHFRVDIDQKCKDIPRLMLLSWDPDVYMNPNAEVFPEICSTVDIKKPTQIEASRQSYKQPKTPTIILDGNNKDLIEQITGIIEDEHLDITTDYDRWWRLAFALHAELGDEGREYYHRISRFYEGYRPDECNKQFDYATANNDFRITLGTIIHYAKEHGIILPKYSTGDNSAILHKSPAVENSQQKMPRARPLIQHDGGKLYNVLKNWRLRQATNEGKKAFQILHNRTLLDIVKKQPKSLNALSTCHGIGAQKLKDYGKDILDILKKNSQGV